MKKYDYLRPAENVVFAAKIWNGTTLYQIDGAPVFFGTKKDAAAYIRENFSGDAQKVRLYDLRNAGRLPRPWLNVLPAVAEDQNAVLRLRKCSRAYRLSATNKTCLEKVFNRGMGQTHFVDVDTRNKTVYYNAAVARRADIQNIRETWPNYAAVPVCLPYYETTSLKSYYLRQNNN